MSKLKKDKITEILKYLKKQKEQIIFDLIIKNYDKTNFYFALVFNLKIKRYKVLFIPIDAIGNNKVGEFACYQFIFIQTVNYIIEELKKGKKLSNKESFCNKLSHTMSSYYIEINTYIDNEHYCFKTTQVIPKEWLFLFEPIVVLFEHSPNIVSELCNKILAHFNNQSNIIEYTYSYDVDIYNTDINIFSPKAKEKGRKLFTNKKIIFFEKIQTNYFAIINNNIFILNYNNVSKILNIYCNKKLIDFESYIYALIIALKENYEKNFFKLIYIEKNIPKLKKYYLCYEVNNENFKVIYKNNELLLPINLIKENSLKLAPTNDHKFEEQIEKILKKKYSTKVVKQLMTNIKDTES